MRHLLRRHYLPIKAYFRFSLVLTYAIPKDILLPFLCPGLSLDTYDEFGFLAVALVQTERLRPSFLPAFMGQDFMLSGYRIFTRYKTATGKSLRGLRILRSDTDQATMVYLGNWLTHYGYEHSTWKINRDSANLDISVTSKEGNANLHVTADLRDRPSSLPAGSPFPDLKTARLYAGPLPFTFDYEEETKSILWVEGVRQHWDPQPIKVTVHQNTFLEQPRFRDSKPVLANAFYMENIPYSWRTGMRERVAETS